MWYLELGIYSRYFDTYEDAELYCGENCISCKNIYPTDDNDEV